MADQGKRKKVERARRKRFVWKEEDVYLAGFEEGVENEWEEVAAIEQPGVETDETGE